MERQDEIRIHENQTILDDFIEDIYNEDVFKCKKCRFCGSSKIMEFICLNPVRDNEDRNVKYTKGCEDYYNEDEVFISNILDDETQSLF